jgi:hypothetical protein
MIIEPRCHYNEQEINQDNPWSNGVQMRLEIQTLPYQLMDQITSPSTHACTCLHDRRLCSLKQSDSGEVQRKMLSAGRAPEHAVAGAHAALPHHSEAHLGDLAHRWWGPVLRAERLAVTSRRGSSERAAAPEGEQWRSIRGYGGAADKQRRRRGSGGVGSKEEEP